MVLDVKMDETTTPVFASLKSLHGKIEANMLCLFIESAVGICSWVFWFLGNLVEDLAWLPTFLVFVDCLHIEAVEDNIVFGRQNIWRQYRLRIQSSSDSEIVFGF
jgi:hypothetical protein